MGNKLGRKRQVVNEQYTRPQGLYAHKDIDHKKLRKLIFESKLAPCYPGEEELCNDHEECPICFLYYPSLNRSRCCTKGICTECFLQMKDLNSVQPTQCPFCKTTNYAVEYRGAKTKEEKGLEQIEEQRVIEAKIRMQQQELQDEEERMQKRLESGASSSKIALTEVERDSPAVPSCSSAVESEESSSSRHASRGLAHGRANRVDDFDLDLEDIMVMEAIWLSIQESERLKNPVHDDAGSSRQYNGDAQWTSQAMDPLVGLTSSPSGGLACAIAALAERQQMSGESSIQQSEHTLTIPGSNGYYNTRDTGNHPQQHIRKDAEWGEDDRSHAAEARTSCASSSTTDDSVDISALLPLPLPPPFREVGGSFANLSGPITPEGFEERMMFARALSLTEGGNNVEWGADCSTESVESRASCASFDTAAEGSDEIPASFPPPPLSPTPEIFEEHTMWAMAISAEARATTSGPTLQ